MSDFTRHSPQSRPEGTPDASAGDATATNPGTVSTGPAAANVAMVLSKLATMGVNVSFKPRCAASESPVGDDEARRGRLQAASADT